MRVLAAGDLHGDHPAYSWLVHKASRLNADAVVLAGDLLGCPDGYPSVEEAQRADAEAIKEILTELHAHLFYIMGNDDMVELQFAGPRVHAIHGRRFQLGDFSFVGYQYSLPFMAGIYEKTEAQIQSDLGSLEALVDSRTVLVTHNPAYGILDIGVLDARAGSEAILALVRRRLPIVHIHGHIHQCFGRQGRHFNVAAAGNKRAMLIDLDSLRHEVVRECGGAGRYLRE